MLISQILHRKGADVATIDAKATVAELVAELARVGVGALVVADTGASVEGIVSERDVVRRMAKDGADTLELLVQDVMTTNVVTCTLDEHVDDLMRLMTENRIRHVPVVVERRLAGIVSIGDVVNARVSELETERQQLNDYISGR